MKNKVKAWLEEGTVDVFLGYKMVEGHPLPYAFSKQDLKEVEELIASPARYALEKLATKIAAAQPELKIGLLADDSSQRALNVLHIWNQLKPECVELLAVGSSASNSKSHAYSTPLEAETSGSYKKQVGIDNDIEGEDFERFDQQQRFVRWMYEFQKCIKCYGCRNICPVCFCRECSLEHPELIRTGHLPPQIPIFHLVRAVHMAGRCIDCGLCEEACPVDIPLRLLYRKVNEIVRDVFDYDTGANPNQSPFSVLGEKVVLEPKPLHAAKADQA